MKRLISCLMTIILSFTVVSANSKIAVANNLNSALKASQKKYVVTSSGVECISNITVGEAISNGYDLNGKESFRKKIEIKNDFFLTESQEYMSGNLLCFYFVFDNEVASLENDRIIKDKTYSFNKYWKTTSSEEIYKSSEQCIVSQRVGIYNRDTTLQGLKNTDEFHIDIICTNTGEISFNIKSEKNSLNKNEKQLEAKTKIEKINKNLIREVSEKDIVCIDDLNSKNNNRYRYITREIYVAYKDGDGDLIADTTIQANFRYNIDTHEVQCLSTSNEEHKEEIDVTMRSGNETRTYAGAYGLIKLKPGVMRKSFEEALVVKCDSKGEILTKFVNWVNTSLFEKILLILKALKVIILSVLGE